MAFSVSNSLQDMRFASNNVWHSRLHPQTPRLDFRVEQISGRPLAKFLINLSCQLRKVLTVTRARVLSFSGIFDTATGSNASSDTEGIGEHVVLK